MIPLIIANWKMNFSLAKATKFCNELLTKKYTNEIIIAPPTPYLSYLAHNFPDINFCAQDVSRFAHEGAYTGEYSASILKSCGINHTLIGHSERRELFNETDEIVAQKASNASLTGITPIVCIGESIEIRRNGNYKDFLFSKLKFIETAHKDLIIAYEPIWAIGTNFIPSDGQLVEAFDIINSYVTQSAVANKVKLVYGGSVNFSNIEKILNLKNISGVLIGKASLDCETLIKILERSYQ